MMTIREWLTKNRDKYTNKKNWMEACSDKLDVSLGAVKTKANRYHIWEKHQTSTTVKSPKTSQSDLIPASDFLNSIDIVKKVSDFISKKLANSYIEDEKLRRKMNISRPKWKEVCSLIEFENNRLTYTKDESGTKTTVWSTEEQIDKAKETISMARYE